MTDDGGVWIKVHPSDVPGGFYSDATGGIEQIVDDYNGTGQRWKVHTFEVDTMPATLTVNGNAQQFNVLVVAGGNGVGYFAGTVTNGGEVIETTIGLAEGDNYVDVGDGGYDPNPGINPAGEQSVFGGITAAPGGTPGSSVTSNITGADVLYGGNGTTAGVRGRGRVGVGGGGGQKGLPGIVIVAYQVAADAVRSVGMADGPITKLHHMLPPIPEEEA